jgi:hypothetical protein
VVELVHPNSSFRLSTDAYIFLDLFRSLTSLFFSVVDDVLVNSETFVVI